jgi:ribonucleoside-diphosphate reductase alpha chain
VSHGDFDELVTYAQEHDCNLGWCYSAKDIADLASGDAEAERKWNEINYLMMTRGIGDLWKTDTANEALPKWYKDLGLVTHGSNLCNEVVAAITNAAGDYPVDWDYACVLSSVNALHHKDWERDDTIFSSFVFLHCVALEAIEVGSKIPGLEATVRFLKDHMSLGLGVVGFHSALQQEGMAYGDLPSTFFNKKMFRYINAETQRASEWIFKNFRPDQCANITRDYGVANAQRMAVAPNLSSALLAGGISQGIEPIYGNVFLQDTPAGKVLRVNPKFLELMQERGYYSQATLDQCKADAGSVRSFDWLTADEKLILRTAFEIPQKDLIRMAGDRQPDIDQSQSLNLFVSADEDEAYIGELNKEILMNPYVKGRYYIRSQSGVFIDKTCTSCT